MGVISKSSKNKISSVLGEIDRQFTGKNKEASSGTELDIYESIEQLYKNPRLLNEELSSKVSVVVNFSGP